MYIRDILTREFREFLSLDEFYEPSLPKWEGLKYWFRSLRSRRNDW
jgi:hypothetical protein